MALAYYEKALAIKIELLGEKHPGTAITLGNLALVRVSQQKYKDAEQLLSQALAIFVNSLGESHQHTITTLTRMVAMYEKAGNETEAERIRKQLEVVEREKH